MPKISAVGHFCLDKFENNQTRTRTTFFRTSKLTELYFKVFEGDLTGDLAGDLMGEVDRGVL